MLEQKDSGKKLDSDEDIEEIQARYMTKIVEANAEDEDSKPSPELKPKKRVESPSPVKRRRANMVYDVSVNSSANKQGNLSARSTGSTSARKR